MQIKTIVGKVKLESVDYGSVVMFKGFHCIVVNGPFNASAKDLPIVRLSDGKLLSVPKREELHVITNVYLASEYTD